MSVLVHVQCVYYLPSPNQIFHHFLVSVYEKV